MFSCFVLRNYVMFISVLLVSRILNNRPQYINTLDYILSLYTLKVSIYVHVLTDCMSV